MKALTLFITEKLSAEHNKWISEMNKKFDDAIKKAIDDYKLEEEYSEYPFEWDSWYDIDKDQMCGWFGINKNNKHDINIEIDWSLVDKPEKLGETLVDYLRELKTKN